MCGEEGTWARNCKKNSRGIFSVITVMSKDIWLEGVVKRGRVCGVGNVVGRVIERECRVEEKDREENTEGW